MLKKFCIQNGLLPIGENYLDLDALENFMMQVILITARRLENLWCHSVPAKLDCGGIGVGSPPEARKVAVQDEILLASSMRDEILPLKSCRSSLPADS